MKYAVLAGAQLCIGAAAIFARFALEGAGPLAVSSLRLGIAAVLTLALLGARGSFARVSRSGELRLAIAGAALAVHFGAWIASLQLTSIAISTLLVCTSPIFTGIYEALAARRAPSRAFWAALGCGAIGLALVASAHDAAPPIPGFALPGALLALLGAVAFAVYLTLVRSVRAGLPTLAVVSRTYAWAAVVLVPFAAIGRESPPPLADARAWLGILALALVSQLLGHTALNSSLRHFTATTIGFSTLLEPAIAAALGAAAFGERLGAQTILGGIALLIAIGFAIRDSAEPPADSEL